MRWIRATFLPASLLILATAGMIVPLPGYVESPGRIVPLAACVEVDDAGATAVHGDFLLMTVTVLRASAFDAVLAGFDTDTIFVGREQIVPRGQDFHTYFQHQQEVFDLTRDLAVAVGLQAAGVPARVTERGVRVLQTAPDTPAADVLEAGDIITDIDGTAVPTAQALREIVGQGSPEQPLTFGVRRGDRVLQFDLAPVNRAGSLIVGVVAETVIDVELPFAVDVASGRIGGPSAGLTIALTVYDKVLPGVDLAAGRTIAGTGSLDRDGRVGGVGSAGLKVIAAARAGADVFLVPAANVSAARAALPAGEDMEIIEVATFDEAVRALERTGDGAEGGPLMEQCPYQGT